MRQLSVPLHPGRSRSETVQGPQPPSTQLEDADEDSEVAPLDEEADEEADEAEAEGDARATTVGLPFPLA